MEQRAFEGLTTNQSHSSSTNPLYPAVTDGDKDGASGTGASLDGAAGARREDLPHSSALYPPTSSTSTSTPQRQSQVWEPVKRERDKKGGRKRSWTGHDESESDRHEEPTFSLPPSPITIRPARLESHRPLTGSTTARRQWPSGTRLSTSTRQPKIKIAREPLVDLPVPIPVPITQPWPQPQRQQPLGVTSGSRSADGARPSIWHPHFNPMTRPASASYTPHPTVGGAMRMSSLPSRAPMARHSISEGNVANRRNGAGAGMGSFGARDSEDEDEDEGGRWPAECVSALMKVPKEVLVRVLLRAEQEAEAWRAELDAEDGEDSGLDRSKGARVVSEDNTRTEGWRGRDVDEHTKLLLDTLLVERQSDRERLESHLQELRRLDTRVQELGRLEAHVQRFDRLESRVQDFDRLESRVHELEKALPGITLRLSALDASVQARLSRLEPDVAAPVVAWKDKHGTAQNEEDTAVKEKEKDKQDVVVVEDKSGRAVKDAAADSEKEKEQPHPQPVAAFKHPAHTEDLTATPPPPPKWHEDLLGSSNPAGNGYLGVVPLSPLTEGSSVDMDIMVVPPSRPPSSIVQYAYAPFDSPGPPRMPEPVVPQLFGASGGGGGGGGGGERVTMPEPTITDFTGGTQRIRTLEVLDATVLLPLRSSFTPGAAVRSMPEPSLGHTDGGGGNSELGIGSAKVGKKKKAAAEERKESALFGLPTDADPGSRNQGGGGGGGRAGEPFIPPLLSPPRVSFIPPLPSPPGPPVPVTLPPLVPPQPGIRGGGTVPTPHVGMGSLGGWGGEPTPHAGMGLLGGGGVPTPHSRMGSFMGGAPTPHARMGSFMGGAPTPHARMGSFMGGGPAPHLPPPMDFMPGMEVGAHLPFGFTPWSTSMPGPSPFSTRARSPGAGSSAPVSMALPPSMYGNPPAPTPWAPMPFHG